MKIIKNKGFTLVELLVVISVIGLLASLLLPALSKARLKATCANCLSNQKQIDMACHLYADDRSEAIPDNLANQPPDFLSAGGFWLYPAGLNFWWSNTSQAQNSVNNCLATNNLLFEYAKNTGVFHCPGDTRINNPLGGGWAYDSYAMTLNVSSGTGVPGAYYNKFTAIDHPSDCAMLVEQCDSRGFNAGAFWGVNSGGWFACLDLFAVYHGSVNTFAYADGHAEAHRWTDPIILSVAKQSITANSGVYQYGQSSPATPYPVGSGTADSDFLKRAFLTPLHPSP